MIYIVMLSFVAARNVGIKSLEAAAFAAAFTSNTSNDADTTPRPYASIVQNITRLHRLSFILHFGGDTCTRKLTGHWVVTSFESTAPWRQRCQCLGAAQSAHPSDDRNASPPSVVSLGHDLTKIKELELSYFATSSYLRTCFNNTRKTLRTIAWDSSDSLT